MIRFWSRVIRQRGFGDVNWFRARGDGCNGDEQAFFVLPQWWGRSRRHRGQAEKSSEFPVIAVLGEGAVSAVIFGYLRHESNACKSKNSVNASRPPVLLGSEPKAVPSGRTRGAVSYRVPDFGRSR